MGGRKRAGIGVKEEGRARRKGGLEEEEGSRLVVMRGSVRPEADQ